MTKKIVITRPPSLERTRRLFRMNRRRFRYVMRLVDEVLRDV